MGLLTRLFGNDHELAARKYGGRESATDRAARKQAAQSARRRARHRSSGATRAARQGQAWEDAERARQG